MKFRFAMGAMLAAAVFCAAPTWAWNGSKLHQEATPEKTKSPKPQKYDITLAIAETGFAGISGACTGSADGFADNCLSGDCTCYTYTGQAKGAAGSGSVTIYESFDDFFGFGGVDGDSGCSLAIGEIDISGSKDTEALSFFGSDCGSEWKVPVGFLSGGCTLEYTDVFADGAVGPCSGTYNTDGTSKTMFKITGTSLK